MDLMVIIGIVLVLMETINGVYWYVMDSVGGMLNAQKHTTKMNFVMVLLEKANGL